MDLHSYRGAALIGDSIHDASEVAAPPRRRKRLGCERRAATRDGTRAPCCHGRDYAWKCHRRLALLLRTNLSTAHRSSPSLFRLSEAEGSSASMDFSLLVIMRVVVSKASSSAGWS